MNYIQYLKPGGNFGDKLKTGIKKFLKAAGEASRMTKDARVNNPGAAIIRDAYAKGDKELAKQLTDEMQTANLTGIALGSGPAPLITGFTIAPVTTGTTLATGMAGGMAGMYGTDKAINYFSNGKYTGWGDWANQSTNGAIGQNTADFFHPGTIFGGLAAGKIGNKIVRGTNRGKLELLNSPTSIQSEVSPSKYRDLSNYHQKVKQRAEEIRQWEALALLTDGHKDNFATFIDDLPDPVKHLSIPTSIKEHIEANVVPRLVQQRPWVSPDNVIADVKLNTEGPWYTASRKVFSAAGYEPRVQGIHTSSTGNITIADDAEDVYRFLTHELRHKIDNGIPLTQHENDLLRAAFGDEFLNIPYAKRNNYDMHNDMVTTIGDARTSLLGYGKGMPIEQQNFFIDQVPDDVIVNAIADSNGYGKEFIQLLQQNRALTPERIKAFREAMKYVGMSALPLLLGSTDTQNYKSGGTIHIKKKNLGSFTRYCNGKVTEECIRKGKNSSNPTTRKRANFAWVARHKFKHEDGGKINYLNYFNYGTDNTRQNN